MGSTEGAADVLNLDGGRDGTDGRASNCQVIMLGMIIKSPIRPVNSWTIIIGA